MNALDLKPALGEEFLFDLIYFVNVWRTNAEAVYFQCIQSVHYCVSYGY